MRNVLSSKLTRLLFYITLPKNVDTLLYRDVSVNNEEEGDKIKKKKHKKKKVGRASGGMSYLVH